MAARTGLSSIDRWHWRKKVVPATLIVTSSKKGRLQIIATLQEVLRNFWTIDAGRGFHDAVHSATPSR
ncbi:MAG: hypothetical protein ABIR62_06610 [Dokdonella sp.]|uniref:hypothetical protein n=1 Tax=Dokdonella sp. TaxID=2291710 RepID=UPI003264245A